MGPVPVITVMTGTGPTFTQIKLVTESFQAVTRAVREMETMHPTEMLALDIMRDTVGALDTTLSTFFFKKSVLSTALVPANGGSSNGSQVFEMMLHQWYAQVLEGEKEMPVPLFKTKVLLATVGWCFAKKVEDTSNKADDLIIKPFDTDGSGKKSERVLVARRLTTILPRVLATSSCVAGLWTRRPHYSCRDTWFCQLATTMERGLHFTPMAPTTRLARRAIAAMHGS